MDWDADEYDRSFGFVTEYGTGLLDLLDIVPPGRVIDVGCGTGKHAAELARRGFDVVGIDADAAMVQRAQELHPGPVFLQQEIQTMSGAPTFDAAFSNAALHWITDQAAALAAIRAVLRKGAPFVAEMGGKDNVAVVDAALEAATAGLPVPVIRKFFPSLGQQAALLESAGFEVELMQWFPRPTLLAAGQTAADWTKLFRANVWEAIAPAQHAEVAREVDRLCAALETDEGWLIDYRRLRFVARAA